MRTPTTLVLEHPPLGLAVQRQGEEFELARRSARCPPLRCGAAVGRQNLVRSGGAFVDVVQPTEDRARADRPRHWPWAGCRRLQAERSMRPVLVVVGREFVEDRRQVLLVKYQHVVETLAT